jgi:hypothetical protein
MVNNDLARLNKLKKAIKVTSTKINPFAMLFSPLLNRINNSKIKKAIKQFFRLLFLASSVT